MSPFYRFARSFIALNYCLFWKEIGGFLSISCSSISTTLFVLISFLSLLCPFLCICCLFPFLAGDSRRFRWLGLLSWIRISADTHLCTDDHEIASFAGILVSKKVPRSEVRPEITVLNGRERDKLLDNALMARQCALMASIWGVEHVLPEASKSCYGAVVFRKP
ncbi:hypothetical protein ES332_A01G136500v1 [Gossypium tomentosum]|uniref:Uncharacterized protein n=1 Tax=Gossypium tomentosum TaxID=34277 RepID=A0A5D2RRK8_GOSTO|nr:hypothetical protein ES332_A01G136500v1 [Gossypium tomentosum]